MSTPVSDWLRYFRFHLRNCWYFRFHLRNCWNLTKLNMKQELNAIHLAWGFQADRKFQESCLGLWLAETFSTSSLKPLNGIWQNLTGSKISTSSTKFVFFMPIRKTRWQLNLWLAETFSTFPLKPLNGIWWNLTGSKISTSSTKFFFQVNPKTRWQPQPLIG